MRHCSLRLTLASASILLPCITLPASITSLGVLDGQFASSRAFGVSPDGSFAAVSAYSRVGPEGALWSAKGLRPLGSFHSNPFASFANAVSLNGKVVVGGTARAGGGREACLWTGGQIQLLGRTPGLLNCISDATDVSHDGSVVVGHGQVKNGWLSFIWTRNRGLQWLPDVPGGTTLNYVWSVSGDGRVVVGSGDTGKRGMQAFYWTSTGLKLLPQLNTKTANSESLLSEALGTSFSGKYIVGGSASPRGLMEAVLWTNGTIKPLGDLPGGSFHSQAYAVSDDGEVVVGQSTATRGVTAFVWDTDKGMRSLLAELKAQGANTTGWTDLHHANDISGDGSTVVGAGVFNGRSVAFLAKLDWKGRARVPKLDKPLGGG